MKKVLMVVACMVLFASRGITDDKPAYRAEDFMESIGLGASPFDRYLADGPFKGHGTNYPPEFFFDLGIRYYRAGLKNDLVNPNQPELVAKWWKKTGARPMLLVDPGKSKTIKADWMGVKQDGDFSFLLNELHRYEPGSVAEIEGPNELNNKFPPQELNMKYKGETDEKAGALYQKDLFNAMCNDPRTKDIPVVMFTAIFSENALAKPCDSFDYLNMHSYQGANVPSSSLLMNMTRAANILPKGATIKPFVPTECGYNVEEDIANHQGFNGSRQAQAYNIPMLLAEYFRHGIHRTYFFALHNADGYGLLESDQKTKRPSWYAVQSFMKLLTDAKWNSQTLKWEGGTSFKPRALRFSITDAPKTVHTLTLQKENGDWYLLIWNELQNFNNGRNVSNPAVPVTLTFADGTPVSCVAVYAQGKIPDDVYANPNGVMEGAFRKLKVTPVVKGNKLAVNAPSAVKILQLRPTAKAGGKAPASPAVTGSATENSATINVSLPDNSGAESVLLFRNGMHIATLPTDKKTTYADETAWLRPGLGYRYAAQSVAADGTMSKRTEAVIVTPDKRPDLIITDFGPESESVKAGDMVRFKGTVMNVGDGATPQRAPDNVGMWNTSVAVTFSIDGKVISWGGDSGDSPMEPGVSRSHVGMGGPKGNQWKATAGNHVLRAYADDINRICGERSKTNNWATRTITVGEYPGKLYVESRPAPWQVNLSKDGTLDWVDFSAWKDQGILARKRKANLIGQVEQVGKGHIAVTGGCPVSMNWRDGAGKAEEKDSHTGLWGNCVGNGFSFSVPADTEERELKVYVSGINGAHCEFSAELSDRSAPPMKDDAWKGNRAQDWSPVPGDFSAVYTVRYRAAKAGEKLQVTWKMIGEPNQFRAQVRLQAATLSK